MPGDAAKATGQASSAWPRRQCRIVISSRAGLSRRPRSGAARTITWPKGPRCAKPECAVKQSGSVSGGPRRVDLSPTFAGTFAGQQIAISIDRHRGVVAGCQAPSNDLDSAAHRRCLAKRRKIGERLHASRDVGPTASRSPGRGPDSRHRTAMRRSLRGSCPTATRLYETRPHWDPIRSGSADLIIAGTRQLIERPGRMINGRTR